MSENFIPFKRSNHSTSPDQMNSNIDLVTDHEWKLTFGTIDELKSGMVNLHGMLSESSTGESMQVTMLYEGDIDIPTGPTDESCTYRPYDEFNPLKNMDSKSIQSERELEQQLNSIKQTIALAVTDLSANLDQIRTVSTEVSSMSAKSDLDFESDLEISKTNLEQHLCGRLIKMASVIRNGLFAEIRTLDTRSLEQALLDLLGNYEILVCQNTELQTKYDDLLASKFDSTNLPTLLNQTSVFELLERETANSVKEVEQIRLNYETELNRLRSDWESERTQLVADLKDSEGLICDLRKTLEESKRDWDEKMRTVSTNYSLLQRSLDSCCARYLCDSSNNKLTSVERLKTFFNRLDACCPWIWDAVEQSTNSTNPYLPNPNLLVTEHKKKLDGMILERNDLEDQLHEVRKEMNELREAHLQLTTDLESKNHQIDQLLKESQIANKRITEQRNAIKRLLNPNTAEAFLTMLRSGHMHNRSDSNTSGSAMSSIQTETPRLVPNTSVASSVQSLDSQNSPTCVTTLPASDISSHCLTMNLSATHTEVPVTTQSPSVLSRVGAAVSAFASAVISPKRRLSSAELTTNLRPQISSPIHSNIGIPGFVGASSEKQIVGPTEQPQQKRVRTLSSENPVPLPMSSNATFSGFAMPNLPDLARNPKPLKGVPKRKPLGEIPVTSSIETATLHGPTDSNPLADKPTNQKPDNSTSSKKQMTDIDFAFLVNGPLAESTAQLPQNLFNRGSQQQKPVGSVAVIQPPKVSSTTEPAFSPIAGQLKSSKQTRSPILTTGQDGFVPGQSASRPLVPSQLMNRQPLKSESKYTSGHHSPTDKSPFSAPNAPVPMRSGPTNVLPPTKSGYPDFYSQKQTMSAPNRFDTNPSLVASQAATTSSRVTATQFGQPKSGDYGHTKKSSKDVAQECIPS